MVSLLRTGFTFSLRVDKAVGAYYGQTLRLAACRVSISQDPKHAAHDKFSDRHRNRKRGTYIYYVP